MDLTLYVYAIPFFLALMGVEYAYGIVQHKNTYQVADTVNSLSTGIIMLVVNVLTKSFQLGVYLVGFHYLNVVSQPESGIGFGVSVVFYLLLVDCIYYWFHRLCHERNILWAFHQTHHQSEHFNLSTALRQSASQSLASIFFYLPLAILGCPPWLFFLLLAVNTLYQFWVHTEHVKSIGWLENILVTPSHHRVHHGQNPEYIDKNHGGILILWDKWFGTFEPEQAEVRYGITRPLNTWCPIRANLNGFIELFFDAWHTKSWVDKCKLWFKKTGWRPEDVKTQYPSCSVSNWFDVNSLLVKRYVFINLLLMVGLLSYFILRTTSMQAIEIWAFAGFIIVALWNLGLILNGDKVARWLEVIRWAVLLAVFV